ncbi:MAG: 50S ribosomal protein L11 methyltransferase, partial [Sphingomonadales bacterium]|nr:50S ribosomal protein L11 methyltransferase [Sphingomonadales bacterium]
APEMKANLANNGIIILSGILTTQAEVVRKAYEKQSLTLKFQIDDNNWSILIFY